MRSSNIPGSYIFLLFFSQFGLYAILVRFSSIIAQLLKNILTLPVHLCVLANRFHARMKICLQEHTKGAPDYEQNGAAQQRRAL